MLCYPSSFVIHFYPEKRKKENVYSTLLCVRLLRWSRENFEVHAFVTPLLQGSSFSWALHRLFDSQRIVVVPGSSDFIKVHSWLFSEVWTTGEWTHTRGSFLGTRFNSICSFFFLNFILVSCQLWGLLQLFWVSNLSKISCFDFLITETIFVSLSIGTYCSARFFIKVSGEVVKKVKRRHGFWGSLSIKYKLHTFICSVALDVM